MDYFDFFNPKTKTTNMVKSPTYYDFSDSLPQKDRRFDLPSAFVRRRRVAGRREDILDWTAEPAGRNRHRGCRCGGCPKARGASVEKWRKYFFSGWAKGLKSRGLAFGFFCRKCVKKVEKIFCIQKFLLTLQS